MINQLDIERAKELCGRLFTMPVTLQPWVVINDCWVGEYFISKTTDISVYWHKCNAENIVRDIVNKEPAETDDWHVTTLCHALQISLDKISLDDRPDRSAGWLANDIPI